MTAVFSADYYDPRCRLAATAMATLLFAMLALAAGTQPATAQQKYDVLPINGQYVMPTLTGNESRAERSKIRSEISAAKRRMSDMEDKIETALENGNDPSSVPGYDAYMKEFRLARMTQTDDQTLSQLGSLREDFLRDFLSDKSVGSGRVAMIDRTIIPEMQKIMEGNYHPGVRLNAILLLGRLNNVEGKSRVGFPQPSPRALGILIQVLTDASDKYPLYLKVGAMAGIQRHAKINGYQGGSRIAAADLNKITSQALAIIAGSAAGQDSWPEDLSYWLRRRSIQTLGSLGNAGPAGEILDAVAKLLKDEKQPFWVRYDALAAIGRLDLQSLDQAKLSGIPLAVAEFASTALDQEAKSLRDSVNELVYANILYEDKDLLKTGSAKTSRDQRSDELGSGMGGLEGGSTGGAGGRGGQQDDKPKVELPTYQLNSTRRVVKTIIYTALQALSRDREQAGLVKLAGPDEVPFIQKTAAVLDRMIKESDKGIIDLDAEEDDKDLLDADKEEEKSVTLQLAEILARGSRDLNELIREQKGDDQAEQLFDANAQSTDTEDTSTSDAASGDTGGN